MTEPLVRAFALDIHTLLGNPDYDKGVRRCKALGLIETMQHGSEEYARLTDEGREVLGALITMAISTLDPDNMLKGS